MQTEDITVSIILPSLLPDGHYMRCLSSIRAALSGRISYEIICVVANRDAFADYASEDLKIIQEEGAGIYNAMNLGLRMSSGTYVYFIGQDDILLPASADALIEGQKHNADLILANVFWGRHSVFRNYPQRWHLIWRNWCHQGLFYNRLRFLDIVGEFPIRFTAQADHYANIVFTRRRNLPTYSYLGCIAWYSSGGFSSQHPDSVFRREFPRLIYHNFGFISFIVVTLRRALLSFARSIKKALG
jgi:glycosyltransferase involved in cell wall biosynthesis